MSLIYYPNPVFKQKAVLVTQFDSVLHNTIDILQKTLQDHRAIGVGANMCGILQRVIIAPLGTDNTQDDATIMINPEITYRSPETQSFLEASLSLPGIEATITRPETIIVTYQDIHQQSHEHRVSGFPATVIQHEIDYLNGIVYLDYLPKVKATLLKNKMKKYLKKVQRHNTKHGTQPVSHTHDHHHHHHHEGNCCDHKH